MFKVCGIIGTSKLRFSIFPGVKGLILDRPIYAGSCILDLSKLFMYRFHYEYVKSKFDAKFLFTDTDSIVYEIKDKNVYEECFKDRELFDFSEYLIDSKYHDISNKKVLGRMKDDFRGQKIVEFVGLKSKMYSLISIDNNEVNKAKGVRHKEFVDILFNKKSCKT